ncbi:hypothetical protein EV426DRAFT_704886 [Tirmania nivea]|nr:hypothetical protein EV426DRAFT_704886 [Tirmania nivea]
MGLSKKKRAPKNKASAAGSAKKLAPNCVDGGGSPPKIVDGETDPQTSDKQGGENAEAAHGGRAYPGPARERPALHVTSPELSRVGRMSASNAHDYCSLSSRSGHYSEMQPPNPPRQRDIQGPERPMAGSRRSDLDEVRLDTPGPSNGQDNRLGSDQRQPSPHPVSLAESIQLRQLYHFRSPPRQHILRPRPSMEPIAQAQSRRPSGLPGLATNAENEGQKGMYAPGGSVSNAPSAWSDAGYQSTDDTDVESRPGHETRRLETLR